MGNYLKRTTTFILALLMLLSVPLQAFAEVNYGYHYDNLARDKAKIIGGNENLPVKPVKPGNGQTAKELIENPTQPAIYTLRTDFKVQRGEKYQVGYQPYIASVGEAATPDEQKQVNKTIDLPDLAGYEKPDGQESFKIDYKTVFDAANGKNETGNATNGIRYQANKDLPYKAKENKIKIKHVFQDLEDFTKYTNPNGSVGKDGELITTQRGKTGSTMEVIPLSEDHPNGKGFVPEAYTISMQVPENADEFILEYRYNRDYYDVVFDTAGGTPIPARTLYYGQVIPKIADIPTKDGGLFQGWKPSVDLKTKDGKEFKANQIITVGTGQAIEKLDNDLIMPESKVTFTAVWKDKEKADYAIQFWAEKADHDDNASLLEKYDYMGTHVYKDEATGTRPDLDTVSINTIPFPDLDQARLNKIWAGARFNRGEDLYLNKFYVCNKKLTHEQNADPANVSLVKSVDPTGKTVYNIYYDRQVYDLYFTKSNAQPAENTFYPEIWGYDEDKGEVVKKGGPGNPYHYKARFNQLMLGWPNDAMQTKGFKPGYQSFGWGPNYSTPNWPGYLDTPPYRLNADEFLDMANYTRWGGYKKPIDKGDGTTIPVDKFDFTTLSFGIEQAENSIPHHMDFWMDGFKDGETIIRYDLYRFKADTNSESYAPKYPKVQGFTGKRGFERAEFLDEDGIDDKNDERAEVTPFPAKTYTVLGDELPIGKMKFINFFFSDIDEFGDPLTDGEGEPLVKPFEKNGYLKFKYTRNKYPLRFNYNPSVIKADSEFNSTNQLDTFYEFPLKALSPTVDTGDEYKKDNPANLLDNPEKLKELKLTDLIFTDPADGKLKVKRPDNLSDQMVFKGWALDPAGTKLIWENSGEKMPNHPVNLYAKWGEPDYKWKVTFDPNGGDLSSIDETKLTQKRKTIQEGDIGQEEINTYAKKGYLKEPATTTDGKQIFTVIQRQKLVEPKKPTRKGYDFMGWEIIRYKRDNKGEYTNDVDNSYRDTYKVPELYSFGNDVVSPIYLKAIWVPNDRVNIDVSHYFLDKDYKLDKSVNPNPKKDILENKRANYLVATTGDKQDNEWILAPHADLEKNLTGNLKTEYEEYNKRVKSDNTYFQQFIVEPAKKLNTATNKVEDNPDVQNNVFKFFYRPFRQREYKVNYIDERFKGKTNEKDGAIIDQELVINGNRHYDARNYRPIPGWVLVGNPQQQLFFDVNEDTNELLGINGTGEKEITFYYKDVRVIETKENDPTPEGYVRVTFKADKGGSFKDKDGKEVTELYYDVIKGLQSQLLPVPKELEKGETKEEGKYYITPEIGKKFIKWDKIPLLNKDTIIKEPYTFTAYFEWSGLSAPGLVRTEAFKDPNGKWTNDFAPKIEDLKKQLVWMENSTTVKPLPSGAVIKLYDETGTELTSDDQVYELVKEMDKPDKDQLVRTVNIKAKVTFKTGQDPQELTIPITVYKNVYEALNKDGDKPLFLSQAEGKEAKEGGLKDVTGDYVKVTIKPTKDMDNKDDKIYWVNKNAWVVIPEVKPDGSSTFINWTADKAAQNENGVFDFGKRHKFTEDTIISPSDAKDVVEQTDPNKKPDVPSSYVKVIVKTTDKATDATKFEKTFWVNPNKEVTIDVTNPTGKTVAADPTKVGAVGYTMTFSKWESTETTQRTWADKIIGKFTEETTIVAKYSITSETIKPIVPTTDTVHTPQGKTPTVDEITKMITQPNGKTIKKVTIVEDPDVQNPGKSIAKVIVEYTDGSSVGNQTNPVEVPVEVHKNIIPEAPGGQRPKDALDNYVKVIFKAGTGGTLSGDTVYYVSPEVEVDMTASAAAITKTPDVGYFVNGEKWTNKDNKTLKGTFTDPETEFVFNFVESKDIVEKTNDPNQVTTKGYVTVTFKTEDENKGKLKGNVAEKTYYVNPKAGIKLVELADGQKAKAKQLAVPKTAPAANYEFDKWYEEIDTDTKITGNRIYEARFRLSKVTLTYDAGEGTGTVPVTVEVAHGKSVRLARPEGLSKNNATFAGWEIGNKTYQPGDEITLNENTTAKAQWTSDKIDVEPKPNDGKWIPKGSDQNAKDFIKNVYDDNNPDNPDNLPPGTKFEFVLGEEPNTDESGTNKSTTIKVTYPNGDVREVQVTYNVTDDVVEQIDPNKKPDVPDDFVKVTVVPTEKAVNETNQVFSVNPTKEVTITARKPEVKDEYKNEGWKFSGWDIPLTGTFTTATTITARYVVPPTPPTPNPNYPNEHHTHTCSGGRYETIIKEKIVKVPVPIVDNSYVKEVRFMQGFRGDFRPKDGLTRAEAAQILANALVEDGYKYNKDFKLPYKDIGEAWYTRAVKIVTQARVFAGYDDSNFRPQDKITRNEWIATLKRFQELEDASGNHMNLKDGHWAMGEIEAAYKEGWLKIYTDGLATYEGDEFIPREEVAAVSNKAFNRVLDKTYIENNYKNLIGYKDVKNDMWSYYDILCASNTYLYKKNFYRANWIKEDNNEFNINTDEFEIVKAKFQRNPR